MSRTATLFSPKRLCIATLALITAAQLAVVFVVFWPWSAGLTQLGAWLILLPSVAGAFAVSLVLLLVAWVRRDRLSNTGLLKRTTALLLLLPFINLFFLFWFPTDERLVIAADRGDLSAVERCLAFGIDADATYIRANGFGGRSESERPLTASAKQGHLEIVEALVEAGAAIDADNQAALRGAILAGKPEIVRYLLERGAAGSEILADVLVTGQNPHLLYLDALGTFLQLRPDAIDSPWLLLRLAHTADPGIAELVADVRADEFGPIYALHQAIVRGDEARALELLRRVEGTLAKPETTAERSNASRYFIANARYRDDAITQVNQESLLYVAAKFGQTALVDTLLANGTPVEPPLDEAQLIRSPLSVAVQHDHVETTERLLASGADVQRAARIEGHPLYIAVIRASVPMIEMLLEAGAPIDAPGSASLHTTPLMVAVQLDDLERTTLLIASGANPSIQTPTGQTACDVVRGDAVREYVATLDCGAVR